MGGLFLLEKSSCFEEGGVGRSAFVEQDQREMERKRKKREREESVVGSNHNNNKNRRRRRSGGVELKLGGGDQNEKLAGGSLDNAID